MFDRESINKFTGSTETKKLHRNEGRRLIRKNGRTEVITVEPTEIFGSYENRKDMVHTLIDAKWITTLIALILTFIMTWFLFAFLWMAVAAANGDQEELASAQCLIGIKNFSGYLMFSIETQTSVGYGSRSITQNCFEAVFLVCCQILVGIGLGGSIVSIVYVKMISPRTQHSDRCFTKNAVICQRDGELCLILRTRDPSEKYGFQNTINAFLIKMKNGDFFLKNIELEPFGMIIWPTEIVHKITKNSPFYDLSAKDLVSKSFEIVVIMEGTSLSTNQSSRTQTSYLSNEILWGHTFKPCVVYDATKRSYRVSHKRFNATVEVPSTLCSAQRLSEVYSEMVHRREITNRQFDREEEEIMSVRSSSDISPESGIVVSPLSERIGVFSNMEDFDSSDFSSEDDDDNVEERKIKVGRFQIRRRSSIIVASLLESLQKYVYNDAVKKVPPESVRVTDGPLETSF